MKNNKALAFLALVFVALFSYWTFEQVRFYLDKEKQKSFDQLPDTSSAFTENLDGNVAGYSTDQNSTDSSVSTSTTWVANDYVKGDITEKPYTVKSGDTLWEIAEGTYGDGSLWVNILQANADDVGFLPNGSQALIFPGQVLQIP
jgi:nucleoid-associated protein YgaU